MLKPNGSITTRTTWKPVTKCTLARKWVFNERFTWTVHYQHTVAGNIADISMSTVSFRAIRLIVDLISFIFFVLSHVRSFRDKSFQLVVDAAAGGARRCIISWIPFIVKCYSASIAWCCTHFENVLSSIQQYRKRTTWPFCIPLRIEVLNW